MFNSNFSACSSRNEPVPAAHAVFISKSVMIPLSILIYFEACPPISKIVSTSGFICAAARPCAVISFLIVAAPIISAIKYLPEPVTPAPITFKFLLHSLYISFNPARTASIGLPAVIRYFVLRIFLFVSITAIFVLIEPISTPIKTSIFLSVFSKIIFSVTGFFS